MTFTFATATREQARARIALQGPGGSGKTKSALKIAEGFAKGGLIGVVDTERGSALKYAPVPGRPDIESHEFVHLPMVICSPENLLAAVDAAVQARVVVLVIDNWSHFWAGKGGLLARLDEESKKADHKGGKYTAWAPVNDLEQDMLDALLNFPGHVICTMRTKNEYEMIGTKVKKIGVKTVQRDGAEYEFDVVMDMVAGTGRVTKTRYTPLDDLTVHHPGEDLAEVILEQLGQGVDPVQAIVDELRADGLTYAGALELYSRAQQRRLLDAEAANPRTGEVMKLGDAIKAIGIELKPAPVPEPSPARQALDEYADGFMSGQDDASGREAGGAEHAEPVAGSTVPPEPDPSSAIPAPMMRKIFALFNANGGPSDRDKRLHAMSLLLGKPVGSMNELAAADGNELLDILGGFEGQGPDALRNLLNKLAAETSATAPAA